MKKLSFVMMIILSVLVIHQSSAQIKEKNKNKDTTEVRKDTSKLDTTDLVTKTGRGTIGSGTIMTDTTSITPPDKTKTGTDTNTQPGSGTEDPGEGTINPGEVNPGTVNPGSGTSRPREESVGY